jgi:hypothetical protein
MPEIELFARNRRRGWVSSDSDAAVNANQEHLLFSPGRSHGAKPRSLLSTPRL